MSTIKFNAKQFGKDVIEYREKKNLSHRQLEKESKVSANAIYRAEIGNLYEIEKVANLCQAIGKRLTSYLN